MTGSQPMPKAGRLLLAFLLLMTIGGGSVRADAARAVRHRVVFGDGRTLDAIDVRFDEDITFLTIDGGHVIGIASNRIDRIDAFEPPPVETPEQPAGDPTPPAVETPQVTAPGARPPVNRAVPVKGAGAGASRGRGGVSRPALDAIISEAATQYGLEVDLLAAVIAVESGFKVDAVSSKGAKGLMQLMPGTARELAVTDPFDPRQNIFGGARYLRRLLDENGNQYWRALAAYNAGMGRVARYDGIPPYRETIEYIRKVIDLYAGRPVTGLPGR